MVQRVEWCWSHIPSNSVGMSLDCDVGRNSIVYSGMMVKRAISSLCSVFFSRNRVQYPPVVCSRHYKYAMSTSHCFSMPSKSRVPSGRRYSNGLRMYSHQQSFQGTSHDIVAQDVYHQESVCVWVLYGCPLSDSSYYSQPCREELHDNRAILWYKQHDIPKEGQISRVSTAFLNWICNGTCEVRSNLTNSKTPTSGKQLSDCTWHQENKMAMTSEEFNLQVLEVHEDNKI